LHRDSTPFDFPISPARAGGPCHGDGIRNSFLAAILFTVLIFAGLAKADDTAKPRAAVFPLAGTATADQKDKVGFSLRAKLDRDGHFEPIDGPTMAELTGDKTVDLSTKLDDLIALSKEESPTILIWGELNTRGKAFDLKVKIRDLRQKDGKVAEVDKQINQPTDMRFVVEEILRTINDIGPFSHPVEEAVTNDPASIEAWKQNPNLVVNGDFAKTGSWRALLRSEVYEPPMSDALPETDKVVIYKLTEAGKTRNVLAMNLSKEVAESNGLACLSAPIDITRDRRYRIQFKYKSDGPTLHVFVKGYIHGKDISGSDADVQSYECQVPPSGPTHGEWKTVICDLNPQNISGSPTFLKIDLYAYLGQGTVMFDDVQLKEVGEQTRHAVDDGIKPPAP
jgi:hypothetical protein